VLETETIL